MSKRIVNISSLLGFILLLSGCGQETSLTPLPHNGEQESVEIHLNASLAQISVDVTRANTTKLMPDNSSIGLYGTRNADDMPGSSPYIDNWEFVTDAQGIMKSTENAKVYFPAGREQAFLYAYSPYTTSVKVMADGNVGIPVKSGDDLLYAYDNPTIVRNGSTETEATPSGTATLAFKHAMAKLNVLVSTSATETYSLNAIAITFSNGQSGYMNLSDGKVTSETSSDKTITKSYDPAGTISNAADLQAQFSSTVIPPSTVTGNAIQEIRITVDDTEYIVYEAASGPAITLTAGSQKTLRINFNLNNQANASLIDWGSDANQDIDYNK